MYLFYYICAKILIGVPQQHDQLQWLNFSPVEEQFYVSQHEACTRDFNRGLLRFKNLNVTLDSLDRSRVSKILKPLLKLRQACIHPQAVRGEFLSLNKGLMTMEELLESMIKRSTSECEESLRCVISSINGMAGIKIINGSLKEAVDKYLEVLSIASQYSTSSLKVDKLQMIHTYYNLCDVLQDFQLEELKREDLQKQMETLEEEYLLKYEHLLNNARQTARQHSTAVKDLEKLFTMGLDHWWCTIIEQCRAQNSVRELMNLIVQEFINEPHWANRITMDMSILSKLEIWIKDVCKDRGKIIKGMETLEKIPQQVLVNEAVDCHLSLDTKKKMALDGSKKKLKICRLCNYESLLKKYESILFDVSKKQTSHVMIGEVYVLGQLNQGTWKPNKMERVLKKVHVFGRSKRAPKDAIEDGNIHFKWLEVLKKEFRNLRVLWRQLRDRISARDELEMAKLRLRLRDVNEPAASTLNKKHKSALKNLTSIIPDSISTIHILEPFQLESYEVKLYRDRVNGQSMLDQKMKQLKYLEYLKKSDQKVDTTTCPVCFLENDGNWGVLSCGHSFCMLCIQRLVQDKHTGNTNLKCPVCRSCTRYNALKFCSTKKSEEEEKEEEEKGEGVEKKIVEENKKSEEEKGEGVEEINVEKKEKQKENFTVKGSYSTKVDAVVKCLLALRKKDETTKALVFSTWERVLDLLESAFYDNEIPYIRTKSGQKFQDSIRNFKENPNVTALLLPLKWGSKGLNLIEATHVLLTEPVLNPADELQALGRVHRIGQTRETFIHRFLVRNTIEERIYFLTCSRDSTWNEKQVTLCELRELFGEDLYPDTPMTLGGNSSSGSSSLRFNIAVSRNPSETNLNGNGSRHVRFNLATSINTEIEPRNILNTNGEDENTNSEEPSTSGINTSFTSDSDDNIDESDTSFMYTRRTGNIRFSEDSPSRFSSSSSDDSDDDH